MFEFKFLNWALVRQSNDGRQYDNLTVPFVVRNVPAGWSWELLIRHGADLNIIPMVESSSGELSYALTASDLAFRGEYAVQLRATSGELVKHTSIETIYVPDSLSGDAQWPTLPTVFSEAVASAENAADRAEAAAETVEGKLDAPKTPGTAGQVLMLDEDLSPVWADPQGGGGGTSDHRQLSHRNDEDQHNIDSITGLRNLLNTFITKTVNDLTNYYLKSDTYSKTETDQLIGAVQQFRYQLATSLPTASASTMGIIYLIPSEDPQEQNVKDEFITLENGGSYSWEQIGSTAIDLTGYATETWVSGQIADFVTGIEVTSVISTALESYRTAADQDEIDSAKYTKPADGIPLSDLDPSDIDDTVTEDSENLITSGAVYAAIGDVESALDAINDGLEGLL